MPVDLASRLARTAFRILLAPDKSPTLQRLGSASAGWVIPTHALNSSWVCYTAGVGEDASFDLALAELGCEVVAIDPTPRAIEFLSPSLERYERLSLAPVALWTENATLEFFPPSDPANVSYSLINRQHAGDPLRVLAKTLAQIAREHGHRRIDLLKLDIEGAEYAVLDETDLRGLGVRILCVEYHNHQGLKEMLAAARRVEAKGYLVAHVHLTDVTFLARP
jgi:FkbM family methyltransferase